MLYALEVLKDVLKCVQFDLLPVDTVPSGDYIHVLKGPDIGCWSKIGRQGGRQVVVIFFKFTYLLRGFKHSMYPIFV